MSILATEISYPYPEESGSGSEGKKPSPLKPPEPVRKESIKIIAVGGGGGNALNHIISKGIEGVDILAVNTDIRSLDMSLSPNKIVLGEKITKGLGAGALPEVGERAANESLTEIREYLKGADMVYLTAGMGGGTGTGALPIIAETAKEMGILTVAVVTKPFSFEGSRRMRYAENGIERLRKSVDALIVVPNDKLLEISSRETPLSESFSMVDEVLRQAVQGVTDLVTRPGLVNVDFADLKSVMRHAGPAVMGIGSAKGENRIESALKEALESPLMECTMHGAKGVLMNITCGGDLGIHEIQQASAYMEQIISEDATFVWGCAEDNNLEGSVEIVLIATGFNNVDNGGHIQQNKPLETINTNKVLNESPRLTKDISKRPIISKHTKLPRPEEVAPFWLQTKNEEKTGKNFKTNFPLDYYDSPTYLRQNRRPKKPQSY